MKIYKQPEPEKLIRLCLKQAGHKTEYLTLCECTRDETLKFIYNLFPFADGNRTNIQVREAIGAKNGKCISANIYGQTPLQASKKIWSNLQR